MKKKILIIVMLGAIQIVSGQLSGPQTLPDLKLEISNENNNFNGEILEVIKLINRIPNASVEHGTGIKFSYYGQQYSSEPLLNPEREYASIVLEKNQRPNTESWYEEGYIRFKISETMGSSGTIVKEILNINAGGIQLAQGKKIIAFNGTMWPDYVFAPTYNLKSIEQLSNFIKGNGHLPGVPSQKEVEANGVDLVEMNRILLEKVEELTLYIIELNSKVKEQEQQLKNLLNENTSK